MSFHNHKQLNSNIQMAEDTYTKSVCENGRFTNPFPTWRPPLFLNVLKWKIFGENKSNVPSDPGELDKVLPVHRPDFSLYDEPQNQDKLIVTWMGHASVMVQIDGWKMITDPIFSERASPVSFAGPRRYRGPPLPIEELPLVDIVLISHNHYDHMDLESVKQLHKTNPHIKFCVPLKNGIHLEEVNIPRDNIIELDWWEEKEFKEKFPGDTNSKPIRVACTPSQHWCKRGIFDDNRTLWCSWLFIGSRTFYFAGDTGYCKSFKEIGRKYGPIDLAAIPIGAYEPRYFMRPQHVDPEEAIQMHVDLKAKKSIGIHWGTFVLTDEYFMEPKYLLRELLEKKNMCVDDFFTINHGESRVL